ncbi:hypothetical protein [Glaesserella sp.]|uniref:hypothetical protein n=1 Tax=Glaesserella sp. TaxID=2094731 RepID=UPI0035A14880
MSIVEINGVIFPYSLEENVGITGSRPISGYISINGNKLTVSASVGSAPNINLKSNMHFETYVKVYYDHFIIASGWLYPNRSVLIKQNYTYLGHADFELRRCYQNKELIVELSVSYIHHSGSGLGSTISTPAKYTQKIWYR